MTLVYIKARNLLQANALPHEIFSIGAKLFNSGLSSVRPGESLVENKKPPTAFKNGIAFHGGLDQVL